MVLQMRYAAKSDVGLVRSGNEDSGYAGPHLLVVADGMGGHAAGELASATAVAILADLDIHPPAETDVLAELAAAIDDAGDMLGATIADDPELTGMGTTITGVYWMSGRFAIVHVGDSRAYLLRDGELSQLTHDHTYVQTLVDAGRITEADAAVHPRRSLMMRAVDGLTPVEADLSIREARAGDRLLLCSDGLSGVLPKEQLAARMADGDPTIAVIHLIEDALAAGAPDNVTAVVADIVDLPEMDRSNDTVTLVAPVVVGAAGEPRVRFRLPHVHFPTDIQPDADAPAAPPAVEGGPPTAEQPLIDSELIVPAAETARRTAIREEAERDSRRRRRRRVWIGIAAVVVVVVVLACAVIGVRSWVRSQWYVALNGAAGTGTVAIYNGVPGSLVGIDLSSLYANSSIEIGKLPLFDQELVSKTIPASSRSDAQRIVTDLAIHAASCAQPLPAAGCPGVSN